MKILEALHDSAKEFYGKAMVNEHNNVKTLYSYETRIAKIDNGNLTVYGTFSPTTLRHLKEFLKQNGFKAETKKQIEKDYM